MGHENSRKSISLDPRKQDDSESVELGLDLRVLDKGEENTQEGDT